MLPKYDGAQRRCDGESRKGWERGIRPGCANDGGVNCRAVLKYYTFIGICKVQFFLLLHLC